MFSNGKFKVGTAVMVLAAMLLQPFSTLAATSQAGAAPSNPVVKIAPMGVSVDTAQLAPTAAEEENKAVWRLFDNDTATVYSPGQTARVAVTLPAAASIGSIRFYGSSSYQLNVYRDSAGAWEPVPSLSGISLASLNGNAWNTLSADAPVAANGLLLEFIPQGNVSAGISEVELWGTAPSDANGDVPYATLAGIKTPQEALRALTAGPHIFSMAATPTEIAIPDGSAGSSSASVFASINLRQKPSLFKRAYLVYDGYNILRPVSIRKRINNGSWSGGFHIEQPEGSTPSWVSQVEEINPAWLVQGENRLEFSSPSGTAAIRNLRVMVETDSGWNSVASVSDAKASDGDVSTSFAIHASGSNPDLQVNFERTVEPDKIRLHVSGPVRLKASLQSLNGAVWQDVKAGWQLDLSSLDVGWNDIALPVRVSTTALRLVFDTKSLRLKTGVSSGAINEMRVFASPVGSLSSQPRIVVSYPRDGEFFGRTAHIQGFALPAVNEAGTANVSIEKITAANSDGAFSVSLTKDETDFSNDPDDSAWGARAATDYAGQPGALYAIDLDRNFNTGATVAKVESRGNASFADNREKYSEKVVPGQAKKIVYEGVTLDIPEGAVDEETEITVIPLTEADLARLDPGMVNVTYPAAGYRFLPHGMKFKKPIKISFGYSKSLFAAGQTGNDVTMFFYNESLRRWQQLTRANVDTTKAQVVSESDHFTDIINSTLVVPEHPQALSFNPNSIKDIKAADPGANINLIEPPKKNNRGTANLSYPIELPSGRKGMQPGVGVQYNSGGGNGWMGIGWDMPVQAISIDTRWGVPRYDSKYDGTPTSNLETETYTLDGEQLTPVAHLGEWKSREEGTTTLQTGEVVKIFHPRVEGQFRRIIRHGTQPNNYWWEVIDKNGTKYLYGGAPATNNIPNGEATLADSANGNIFKWALRRVQDTNGNTVNYTYSIVANTGLQLGTVMGHQIYLQKIDYTGYKDDLGAYTVLFTRDREMDNFVQRPDVTIDARSGFKVVTADLLRNIEVYFGGTYLQDTHKMLGGKLVRRYEFKYGQNPYGDQRPGTVFNKTLLTSVSQLGTNGTLFNTHQFTYYDEARKPDSWDGQDYKGFQDSPAWDAGKDGITVGLLGKGVASALGGNSSKSAGFHVYAGIGPATGEVTNKKDSAGAKIGYSRSKTESVLTMADMDGDGLPDKVIKDDGGFYYRKNLSGPRGTSKFGERIKIDGLTAISKEKVTSITFGIEEYFTQVPIITDLNKAVTSADTYFSDVNGDGLPDLVSGGHVVFGYRNSEGKPVFESDSGKTPVPIGVGKIDTDGLLEDPSTEEAERAEKFPLLDTIHRWVAPFDGVVRIDAPVKLIQDTGKERAEYDGADGVLVAIQQEGAELWSSRTVSVTDFRDTASPRILADDYQTHIPTGVSNVSVKKGDRIYFRVQSVFDGAYDRVEWDPEITYLNTDTTRTDVNSLAVYRYRASEDFTLAGRRGSVIAPLTGTLHLGGSFEKTAPTTDDVTLVITHKGSEVYSRTLAFDETSTVEVSQDLAVTESDELEWRVLVDSPIDATRVKCAPQAYYTAATGVDDVKDDKGNYIIQVNAPYSMEIYPADGLTAPQAFWKAPETGSLTIVPQITMDQTVNTPSAIVFTVKKKGALLGKGTIALSKDAEQNLVASPVTLAVPVTKDDELFFDFSGRDTGLATHVISQSVGVSYQGTGPAPTTYEDVPAAYHGAVLEDAFPEPYRGWGAAGYNGNSPRDKEPVDQSLLVVTETYDKNARVYPFAPRPAGTPAAAKGMDTVSLGVLLPENFDQDNWGGVDESTWVKAKAMSSSRLGLDDIRMPRSEQFANASAPSRISKSSSLSVTGGFGSSKGDSTSKLDFQDLNGDRFPDVVGEGGVQYTRPTGTLESAKRGNGLGSARSSHNETFVASYSGAGAIARAISNARGSLSGNKETSSSSQGTDMPPLGFDASGSYGTSETKNDLIDINGDGLPDKVFRNGEVALNLGYSFAPAEQWGGGVISDGNTLNGGVSMSYNKNWYSLAVGMNLETGETKSDEIYVDINGDGLTDKVKGGNPISVSLNNGGGFTDIRWAGGQDKVAADKHISLGGGAFFTFGFKFWVLRIVINPGVNFSSTMGRPEYAFRDMDGDGYVDHVYSKDESELKVALNPIGRTNLLKTVKLPLGGKFDIEYDREGNIYEMPQSQWLMTKVSLSDGMGRTYRTRYAYSDPHQDRLERDFYGFRTVTETQAPGSTIERSTTDTFHTTKFNDERDYYLKGLLLKSVTSDRHGNVWASTANTYTPAAVMEGKDAVAFAKFPALTRTDTYFYDGATAESGYRKSTFQTFAYDSHGNVTSFFDAGELATGADDVTATISYWQDPQQYIFKPDTIEVKDSGKNVLRKRWASYENGTGNLRSHTSLATSGQSPVWQMSYDAYGNIRTIADPVGYALTYSYDNDTNSYVTRIEDSFSARDGGPYYSTAGYDMAFGQPLWTKDLNGNFEARRYDEFGRLVSVHGPYDTDTSGNPLGLATLAFAYQAPVLAIDGETLATPAGAVTRNKAVSRVGSVGDTLDTVTFVDGMKRLVQTKKEADVNGVYGMVVSGLTVYDELGRTVQQGQPVFQNGGNLYGYLPLASPKNPTNTAYDPLDRSVRLETPDAKGEGGYAVTTINYGFGKVNNSDILYATTKVVDPIGTAVDETNRKGTKISYKDVDDRIAAVVEYNYGAPIVTGYDYDPLGQITQVKDDRGNRTSVEYDMVGRRTAITNPDTGRTEYGYDANGNLTSKLSANYQRGKEIKYDYIFNRLMRINYPNSTNVLYEYGAMNAAYNRAGRITKVTDESGVEERFYGKLGETTREVKSVNAKTPSAQRKSYTTDYVFDSFGRMNQMTYPDGETLYYSYDNGGLLNASWGAKLGNRYNYINALTYDEFGQRRHIAYGNGVVSDYSYDDKTRRLEALTTVTPDQRSIQNLSYDYDLVGNILKLQNQIATPTNTALPAGPLTQVFEYDDLYQLKTANGEYAFGPGKKNLYNNEFIYDTIGNFTRKGQIHKILQPSMSEHLPKETNYALDYKYGSFHPHAVTDAGDKLYSYDANGNMTGWDDKKNGQKRNILWNEENRVKEIQDNGRSTYFLYDDAGERVLKRGQHGETFYLNRFYSMKDGALGTKSIYAGNTRVVTKLVKTPNTATDNTAAAVPGIQGLNHGNGNKTGIITRLQGGTTTGILPPEEKDQYFYHGDHLGSSNMITDTKGSVYQHLENFPYGETWIDEGKTPSNIPGYKFTGKELDPETGLYYFGARYYEPVISKWISADPLLWNYLPAGNEQKDARLPGRGGVYNPLNQAMYNYGHQNPAKFTDPDGNEVIMAEKGIGNGLSAGENSGQRSMSSLAAIGGHTWIILRPDHPEEFNRVTQGSIKLDKTGAFVIRGGPDAQFESTGKGNLVGAVGGAGDSTSIYRQHDVIPTPSQYKDDPVVFIKALSADTKFILSLVNQASSYKNNLPYHGLVGEHGIPGAGTIEEGVSYFNSNSFTAGVLKGAGVSNIPNPWFYQPGIDKPISTGGGGAE